MRKILLLVLLLALFGCKAHAAATLVQATSCNVGGTRPTSTTCTYVNNVVAGNTLLALISADHFSTSTSTNQGDNTTKCTRCTVSIASHAGEVDYVLSANGGSTTWTFNYSSGTNFGVVIEEWSGLDNNSDGSLFDQLKNQGNASAATIACPTTLTTNTVNDVIIATYESYQSETIGVGPPAGFTADGSSTTTSADIISVFSKSVAAFGTQTAAALSLTPNNGSICRVMALRISPGSATNTGVTFTTSATTVTDDAGVGTGTWTNPNNGSIDDASYATAAVGAGNVNTTFHYLKALGFGFSIAATSVTGVQTEWKWKVSSVPGCGGGTTELTTKLFLNNVASGNDRSTDTWALTGTQLSASTTEAYQSIGSPSDTWGLALAQADINNVNFGVGLSLRVQSVNVGGTTPCTTGAITASVNAIRMTVFYTASAAPGAGDGSIIIIGRAANGEYLLAQTRYAGQVGAQ